MDLLKNVQYNGFSMPPHEIEQIVEEKDLVTWKGPSRPFKRRTREFYVTLISIVVLLGAILFLIEGVMPVLLLAALVFLFYVLSTVAPEEVEYKITNYGVRFAGRLTSWDTIGRFWFMNRLGSELLIFETFGLPGRLELVVTKDLQPKLEESIKKYAVHEEVPPGVMDKAAHWASKRLPQS